MFSIEWIKMWAKNIALTQCKGITEMVYTHGRRKWQRRTYMTDVNGRGANPVSACHHQVRVHCLQMSGKEAFTQKRLKKVDTY